MTDPATPTVSNRPFVFKRRFQRLPFPNELGAFLGWLHHNVGKHDFCVVGPMADKAHIVVEFESFDDYALCKLRWA